MLDKLQLEYHLPSDDLTGHVTVFYHFNAQLPRFDDTERADHAQLRFRLTAGGGTYRFPDGTTQDAGDIHIIGPTSGAVQVSAPGPVELIGCGITPVGWAAMIGSDASAMLNRVLDGESLFGPLARQTLQALKSVESFGEKVVILEDMIRRIEVAKPRDLDFARVVDDWLAGTTSPEIDVLVEATSLSPRQLERRCKALYGLPPKMLARKYRALRAAVAMMTHGDTPGDAVERGFYDQSHLIREVKHFTGLTPGKIRESPGLLAQLTIAERYGLGGSVHRIVSDT
ncbi:helix-turn-helix domain-containing protein [Stakelama sediminis]|uniref:AraC-like DNA-binding protein n=1 Tax=Stakelama sediminis TaxID=463200 RepID=A0A840YXC0_9SPHN|nr:helix-turn-helix domain-containing protein [Stakelama sediminis]MBB5718308.1 AraC-like DNA-binding protein [Stakelama sediminis]